MVPIVGITGAVQLLLKFVCFPEHSGTLSAYSEEADFKICGINATCTFEIFKTNDNCAQNSRERKFSNSARSSCTASENYQSAYDNVLARRSAVHGRLVKSLMCNIYLVKGCPRKHEP
jgi:hypothetical protein